MERRTGMPRMRNGLAAIGTALVLASAAVAAAPSSAYADDVNYCNPTINSFGFGSPSVAFGAGTTLSWNVQVPEGCDGMAFQVLSGLPNGYWQNAGAAGSLTVTPLMLGFGVNTWDLMASFPNTDISWHIIAETTVTVTMPQPQPDGSDVTISDDSVQSRVNFVSGVMAKHATVRVAGNVDLDLSSVTSIPVGAGTQILGDRTVNPAGPRIFTTTIPHELLMLDHSDDVRISGIRLEGGETDDAFSGVGPLDSDGIGVFASQHVQIDHNEIYHWRGAGVNVHDGNDADNPTYVGRLNRDTVDDAANAHNVWVHDNYIHHNQHPAADNCIDGSGHAGGYGVEASDGGYVKIERNVFDWDRHSIAGDGKHGTGYVARDNLILPNGGVHFKCIDPDTSLWDFLENPFPVIVRVIEQMLDGNHIYHTHAIDMHGTSSDCGVFSGDHNCGGAGEYMAIEDNTILYTAGNGIHLRGTPAVGMFVRGNVFAQSRHDGSATLPGAMVQNELGLYDQGNTLGLNTFGNRKSCDFDADGRADDFIATGIGWWYAASRLGGRWVFLNRSTALVGSVTLADVNGDGMCDVTSGGTVYPTTTDSLSLGAPSGTAGPGATVTTQVNFAPVVGPRGPQTLTATGVPAGVTASFSPATVSAGSPVSTVTFTNTTGAAGTYPITIHAGASAQPVVFSLALQDFSLSLGPPAGGVVQGGSVATQVHLNALNGFTGSVNLGAGLPSGMSASFNPATVSPAHPDSTMTITTTSTTFSGLQAVVVSGTVAGSGTYRTTNYELTVGSGYTIFVSLQNDTVALGGSATTEVTLNPTTGIGQSVVPYATHVPAGVTVAFSQQTLTSTDPTATVTITATGAATPGTYTFYIGAGLYAYYYQLTISAGAPSS